MRSAVLWIGAMLVGLLSPDVFTIWRVLRSRNAARYQRVRENVWRARVLYEGLRTLKVLPNGRVRIVK